MRKVAHPSPACEQPPTNARALKPDVVLTEICMPRADGIEAARRIVTEAPAAKVIMLTTFDLDQYVVEALRAGAGGFLDKDGPAKSLVDAVRAVTKGEAMISPRVTARLPERFTPAQNQRTKKTLHKANAVAHRCRASYEIASPTGRKFRPQN